MTMYPKLLHLYGPLYINSYGVAIAIGLLLLVWLAGRDKQLAKYITKEQLHNVIMLGIVAGLIGGRVVDVLNNWHELAHWLDAFAVWQGGLSITGTIIGVVISTLSYLWYHNIPILRVTDRGAIYAPLTQAFGRIGCFIAGCCYGVTSSTPLAVTYTHHDSFAPLYLPLHPTQLYSAAALFFIFFILYALGHTKKTSPGLLTMLYLVLVNLERFIIDFWRGDRLFFATNMFGLSVHQWLSGGIVIGVIILYLLIRSYPSTRFLQPRSGRTGSFKS